MDVLVAHWLASANGRVHRRWSAALALIVLVVLAMASIRLLPRTFAPTPAHSASVSTSSSEQIVTAAVTPSPWPPVPPSPAHSESDLTAQTQANGPTAAIANQPTSVPSLRPTPVPPPASTTVATVPPVVILTVTPLSGLAPLTVTADASRSTGGSGIAGYTFDFGDGSVVKPMQGATASHKYCLGGIYRLKVTVTDKAGLISSAFLYVTVTQPVSPVSC